MKTHIVIIIVCFLLCSVKGNAQKEKAAGIDFMNSYTEALSCMGKGKSAKKLLFVYCSQENNPACSKMGNLVLKTKQVSDFISQNFVSLQVDAGKEENEEFIKRHSVAVYPSYLVLDRDGNEIGCFCGFYEPADFLKKMRFAMDESNSVKAKLRAFEQDRTTANGRECMEAYYQSGRISEMVDFVERYFYAYTPEERYSTEMWKYVAPALMNPTSKVFSLFLSEKYLANKGLGKSIVDEVLSNSIRQYALWFVSGKLKDKPVDAMSLISRLGLIDDQNVASHYICIASQLYSQKAFMKNRIYDSIMNYISVDKVCALAEKDRAFVEHFLFSIEGMPQQLIDRYKEGRKAYFDKILGQ